MKTWIVSHDAGGAEILAAWVRQKPNLECELLLEGPARKVFRRYDPKVAWSGADRLTAVQPGDLVLTGTGWASDLEKRAIAFAKRQGVRVASFIDHWVNYRERFTFEGRLILPDEIWVGDDDARCIAQGEFPDTQIVLVPNPYLQAFRREFQARAPIVREPGGLRILYVCEALSEGGRRADQPETRAIQRFLSWWSSQGWDAKTDRIRLRLHPAENPDKYRLFLDTVNNVKIEVGAPAALAQDCAWADWVVGMSSMALVSALSVGKVVFSCMPTAQDACPLPQAGISRI